MKKLFIIAALLMATLSAKAQPIAIHPESIACYDKHSIASLVEFIRFSGVENIAPAVNASIQSGRCFWIDHELHGELTGFDGEYVELRIFKNHRYVVVWTTAMHVKH